MHSRDHANTIAGIENLAVLTLAATVPLSFLFSLQEAGVVTGVKGYLQEIYQKSKEFLEMVTHNQILPILWMCLCSSL